MFLFYLFILVECFYLLYMEEHCEFKLFCVVYAAFIKAEIFRIYLERLQQVEVLLSGIGLAVVLDFIFAIAIGFLFPLC